MEKRMEKANDMDFKAVHRRMIQDMSEGIIVLGMSGKIQVFNPAAARILAIPEEEALGKPFGLLFFNNDENDLFCQTILDAIYDSETAHRSIVPYANGTDTLRLHVSTSFLFGENRREKLGVIAVLADVSELLDLRDKLELRNRQISALLDSLVTALATAIDERSHYNANHTRNMVRFAEAFLDWLDRTGSPLRFDAEKRNTFLMSVWLHDVGKLAVPLRVMDKPTRLGPLLDGIYSRFQTMRLLDRIAALEGRIGAEEYQAREAERERVLNLVEHVNASGFLPDDLAAEEEAVFRRTYTGENGEELPWFTEEEQNCLLIRRGTLTEQERQVIQNHASVTRRVLERVSFPDYCAEVPLWASSHHELLNGKGYPDHLTGDAIPPEVRLLTILDIFEALTASDRPYKKPVPLDRALGILHSMAEEGSLDGNLLALFERSRAWEGVL